MGRPPLSNNRLDMPIRFHCDYCSKGFYYNSMLTQHRKTHISGATRETCPECGLEYATRQVLKSHMIKTHGNGSFVSRPRGRPPRSGRYHRGFVRGRTRGRRRRFGGGVGGGHHLGDVIGESDINSHSEPSSQEATGVDLVDSDPKTDIEPTPTLELEVDIDENKEEISNVNQWEVGQVYL